MFKRKKSQEAPPEQNTQGAEQAPATSQKDKFLGFAKVVQAKMMKAAKRALYIVTHYFNDSMAQPTEGESTARRVARIIFTVPKMASDVIVSVARVVAFALYALVVVAFGAVTVGLGMISALALILIMVLFKLLQLAALVVRTPFLFTCGMDAVKCDWGLHFQLWKPSNWYLTSIQQVLTKERLAKLWEDSTETPMDDADSVADAAAEALGDLADQIMERLKDGPEATASAERHPAGKGRPTPKQVKTRPTRLPKVGGPDLKLAEG